jgi:hypothetical protein
MMSPSPAKAGRRGMQATARPSRQSGSLLIDATLAMAVLFIAILSLFSSLISGQTLSRGTKSRHQVVQDVTALMEQLDTIPILRLPLILPHDTDVPEFTNLHVRGQRLRVLYADGDPTARPLFFSVESTYDAPMGQRGKVVIHGVRAR